MIMKKPYMIPSQMVCELHANKMMALSLGGTADNSEVLGKENNDWFYYDEEDDSDPIKDIKFF